MARKRVTNVRRHHRGEGWAAPGRERKEWYRWGDFLTRQSAEARAAKLRRRDFATRVVPVRIGTSHSPIDGFRLEYRVL